MKVRILHLSDLHDRGHLFLKAHEKLRYQEVVAVLAVVRGSGVSRVGIVRPD